jgi:DNA-binding transcriptional ArsR family regulator
MHIDNNENLDLIFGALADATRRGMLAQLSEGEVNITALAEPYDMSQPAISKHLRVLERAGLIARSRRGRDHYIKAVAGPAEQAGGWIAYYAKFWKLQFDDVETYLQANDQGKGKSKNDD